MTTIFILFVLSLTLSMVLTPVIRRLAGRHHIVDQPSERKIHTTEIPRIGGVAVFLGFILPFGGAFFYYTDLLSQVLTNQNLIWLAAGGLIMLVLGLIDDIHPLSASIKLGVQIFAAVVAWQGGIAISGVQVTTDTVYVFEPWFACAVTIFWFVLMMNAMNLIDGLDGLATGLCFFASLVLLILSLISGRFFVAMGFSALAGSCLGFLRYNFNPASIFLGDSGSYFLGYMLAGLAILGSMKGQAMAAILIPIIALGIPIIDTILTPIRRFLRGRKMFDPDRSHVHHRLMSLGLNHRNAVLVLYGLTIALGVLALIIVHSRDTLAAFILAFLGIALYFGVRKLWYLDYFAFDKIGGYFQDVTDMVGLSRHRRTFLDRQIEIGDARNHEALWERTIDALKLLKMDRAEIRINGGQMFSWAADIEARADDVRGAVDVPPVFADAEAQGHDADGKDSRLSIQLPLVNGAESYGALHLEKDVRRDPLTPFTLRRIEHLRRTLVTTLKRLEK